MWTVFKNGDRAAYRNDVGIPLVGRGTTMIVGIAAEMSKPNSCVDMIKALPSGIKELVLISKTSSTFGLLHKHLRMRFTMYQIQSQVARIDENILHK